MSFLDDIIDVGKSAFDFVSGNGVASNLVKTALLGFGVSKVSNSVTKQNQTPAATRTPTVDPGVRLQVNPDPSHKIPVVYGTAQLGGIITDAELTSGNQVLYTCFTICERTGVKLSDNVQSSFVFNNIYLNDQRCVFQANSYTVAYTVDRDGNVDYSLEGLVDVRCYVGGAASTYNVAPVGYNLTGQANAWDYFPNWTSNNAMSNLIFVVVKMNYNRDKGLTRIPTVRFSITNNMTKAGDCVYDYMTNTRYGAGIPPAEIYSA